MSIETLSILTLVGALVTTIILMVTVTPRSKDGKFSSAFAQMLHNIFNFKALLIEGILKFFYIFGTFFMIIGGFFSMFLDYEDAFVEGFLTMILGPIFLRIMFELVMMVIILVQKVISIEAKLKNQNERPRGKASASSPAAYAPYTPGFAAPAAPAYSAPVYQEPAPVYAPPVQAEPVAPAYNPPVQAEAAPVIVGYNPDTGAPIYGAATAPVIIGYNTETGAPIYGNQ